MSLSQWKLTVYFEYKAYKETLLLLFHFLVINLYLIKYKLAILSGVYRTEEPNEELYNAPVAIKNNCLIKLVSFIPFMYKMYVHR